MKQEKIANHVTLYTYDYDGHKEISLYDVTNIKRQTKTSKGTTWTDIIITFDDDTVQIITLFHSDKKVKK